MLSLTRLLGCRHSAIRGLLHRALLHLFGGVREPVLLPVWLLVPGLCHLGGLRQPDQHRHGLFPALLGKLPLVVEELLRFGRLCALRPRLLFVLLLDQAQNRRVRAHAPLLYLHANDGRHLLAAHGHHWLLRGILLYQEDLRSRQN